MIIESAGRLDGIGEYYFSKKLDEVRKLRAQGVDVINLGIGSPDLAPSEATVAAAAKTLQDKKAHGYAPYRCSPEFRKALADWYLKVYQVKLDPETEVLPLLGSKEGILYSSLAFVNPGETILVPNPGYPAYTSVAKLIGAKVATYDLTQETDWLPDFKKLEKMNLQNCKIMWVNYPHMPTGRTGSRKLFSDLVAFARHHKILICHDNPYGLVLNSEPPISILSADPKKEVCLELNSFSKAFNMAGWRVGLLASQKDVVDAVLKVKSNVDSGMFTAIQMGAVEALRNSEEWHNERNHIYRQRQEVVCRIFSALGFTYAKNQTGLFIWAKAPDKVSDVPIFIDRVLYEARVFITPGFIFGSNGDRYARSSLCAPKEILEEALKRVTAWSGAQI